MTDNEVKRLQQYLNLKGYIVSVKGLGSVNNESTYFGNATKQALIKYQKTHNILPSSGLFGPITRKAMNEGR